MKTLKQMLGLLLILLTLGACSTGYTRVLFTTKSNIGLDFDPMANPPTAEITISRREGVVTPTYEGGQAPPLVASFRSNVKGLTGIFADVSSTFAGGAAAATMTDRFDSESNGGDIQRGILCVRNAPELSRKVKAFADDHKPSETRAFVFGTDTTLGFRVGWSPQVASPEVKLGYNRRELASAPVFARLAVGDECPTAQDKTATTPARVRVASLDDAKAMTNEEAHWVVNLPSFVGAIDTSSTAGKELGVFGLGYFQYFATGDAATSLALAPSIRAIMKKRIDPGTASGSVKQAARDLEEKSRSLIGSLDDAKIARATDLAVLYNLLKFDDTKKATVEDQRKLLSEKIRAGDTGEGLANLLNFVAWLERL